MIEKILVPTDFSDNSKAGIHFALQLSRQRSVELVFIHVNKSWEESISPDLLNESALRRNREEQQKELESFVRNACRSSGIQPRSYSCVIYYRYGVVESIIDYAEKNDFSYICISTHGAGNITQLFGTNTGALIKESGIPVLCIPKDYRAAPVSRLLYASDLANHPEELKKVVSFGQSIGAEVDILHCSPQGVELTIDEEKLEKEIQRSLSGKIVFHHKKFDSDSSLLEEIDNAVTELSPSLLVMFTKRDRNFFQLLFSPSKSEKYSFRTRVPLLVYNKD